MPRKSSPAVAIAACFAELAAGGAPSEIRLIPAGPFKAWDGRPGEGLSWQLSDEQAAAICTWSAGRASDLVIDYEHATLSAQATGNKAPAAGWFKALEWRPGNGLYATDVRWTDAAAAMIKDGEKRYISPVFGWDKKTGAVLSVVMAGLVNNPGLDGLSDLSALSALAASLSVDNPQEEPAMDELIEKLQWLLNMPVGSTPADYVAQLQKIITQLQAKGAPAALGFDLAKHLETTGVEIAALKAATPDPALYVPVVTMSALQADLSTAQTELAALKAEQQAGKVTQVIQEALSAGKLAPVQEEWARALGNTNLESLSAYLATVTPGIKPGATQTGGQAPAETAALSAGYVPPAGFGVDPRAMETHTAALAWQAAHPDTSYEAAVAAVAKA